MEYPGHNATKLELMVWFNQMRADLTAAGFGSTLRKETPRESVKLQDRSLIAVPSEPTAAAAITIENAKIEHQNKLNAIERLSIENEYKSKLASRLHTAMIAKAQSKLEELQKKHPLKNGLGTDIPDAYDGAGMWFELTKVLTADELEEAVKEHQRMVEVYGTHVARILQSNEVSATRQHL